MTRFFSYATATLVAACSHSPSPLMRAVPPAEQRATVPGIELPEAAQVRGEPAPPPMPAEPVDSAQVSASDVSRRAAEVFGDSAATVDSAATAEPSWDIDVRSYASRARVEHYVRLFSGTAREHIEAQLGRGTRYESMIRSSMREGGLPEDMYYLALIESGFDPNAYSSAAAVGMWQFMTSTARGMGLRVDWWVDERRDPVKSTDAAVRFIKDLKAQFGSLYLAAAAYNGGPGRVSRGLSRYADDLEGTTGDDLFFALAEKNYFRRETREYVPQLIAAALIAKEPERYGMSITSLPAFTYDSVVVGPSTPLAAIASAANTEVADLQELNPQILRGITPPKDSLVVRIPTGAADSFAVAFERLPSSDRTGFRTTRSKKGESYATIARRTGISARQLARYNPKVKQYKSGRLVPGQRVVIPTKAVVAAAVSVPDPAIERYSTKVHIVRSGETLSGIAKRYHTTTAALMRRNGLRRSLIIPGQSLVVNGSAAPKRSSAARKTAAKPTRKPSAG